MALGRIPRMLMILGSIWSVCIKIAKPLLSLFSAKFREREQAISLQKSSPRNKNAIQSLWIHVSSLGEFEQARPIIEEIKKRSSEYDITLTFFSPSGYRIRKSYEYADRVLYLPIDTLSNVQAFMNEINPDLIIFIRYELWLNYLIEARRRAIPCYALNATFPRSMLWKFFPAILRSILGLFSELYTIGSNELASFQQLNLRIPIHSGHDTRIDRIHSLVQNVKQSPAIIRGLLPGISDDKIPCIVLGSSWEADERIFIEALTLLQSPIRLIIVPHEPTPEHCLRIKEALPNSVLQSEIEYVQDQHVIIDSIGKLLAIYSIADAAYIGGGFGSGVHSCAEPAGYGIPLACGPFIERSPDAETLQEIGALEIIKNSHDALAWMNAICAGAMNHAGEQAHEYIQSRRGMTEIVLREIIGMD
ncbi:MAG: 3-deoxy-D-manno-octulosonic-acid transferase [Bacteroidota bacterium]